MEYKNLGKEFEELLNNLLQINTLEAKLLQNCDELMRKVNKLRIDSNENIGKEESENILMNFNPDNLNEFEVIINKLQILYKKMLNYLGNKYILKLDGKTQNSFDKILFINKTYKKRLTSLEYGNITKNLSLFNAKEILLDFIDSISYITEHFYPFVEASLDIYKSVIEENIYYKNINFEKINYIKRSINSNEIIYISGNDIETAFNISLLDDEQNLLIKNFLLENHELYKKFQKEKINTLEKINIENYIKSDQTETINQQNIISYKNQKMYACVKNLISVMELNYVNIINEIINHMTDNDIEQLLSYIKIELNEYCDLKELENSKQELQEIKSKITVLQKLYNYISNFLINKKLEINKEDCKIIFASDKQGVPFIIKDLIDEIDDKNKITSLNKCFEILSIDTLNPTKRKKIANNNQLEAYEIKAYQSRLIYQYLPNNYILITQFLIKKDNNDVYTRKKISDRLKQAENEYNSITAYLKDGQKLDLKFLEYQKNLLNNILDIEDKNSLQLLKKIV